METNLDTISTLETSTATHHEEDFNLWFKRIHDRVHDFTIHEVCYVQPGPPQDSKKIAKDFVDFGSDSFEETLVW